MQAAHIYLIVVIGISKIHVRGKHKDGTQEKRYDFDLAFKPLFSNSEIKKNGDGSVMW